MITCSAPPDRRVGHLEICITYFFESSSPTGVPGFTPFFFGIFLGGKAANKTGGIFHDFPYSKSWLPEGNHPMNFPIWVRYTSLGSRLKNVGFFDGRFQPSAAGSIIYYDASSLSWLESQSVDWDWPTGWGPWGPRFGWVSSEFTGDISWDIPATSSNCNWALITVMQKNMGIVHQLLILGMGWAPVDIFHIAMAHHHLNAGGSKQITINIHQF